MKLSYLVTVHNEHAEVLKLLQILLDNKREKDEIVVLQDCTNLDKNMEELLLKVEGIKREQFALNNHFANFKNYGNSKCSGDFIVQLDADEWLDSELMETIVFILEQQTNCDLILLPRINTVKGLDKLHIAMWHWNVNNKGWVNFPDYQYRVYRNADRIKWTNAVHEIIVGFDVYFKIPDDNELLCLKHPKTLDKQVKQNEMYSKIGE